MSTTAFLVEILVTGFFCIVWLSLVALRLHGVAVDSDWITTQLIPTAKQLSAFWITVGILATYQVGWVINFLSLHFARVTMITRIRRQVFGARVDDYGRIRYEVLLSTPLEKMREDHGEFRLTRSAVINFAGIGMGMLLHGHVWLASFSFLTSVLCFCQARGIYRGYCQRTLAFYDTRRQQPAPLVERIEEGGSNK